jgi:hypothetical protein
MKTKLLLLLPVLLAYPSVFAANTPILLGASMCPSKNTLELDEKTALWKTHGNVEADKWVSNAKVAKERIREQSEWNSHDFDWQSVKIANNFVTCEYSVAPGANSAVISMLGPKSLGNECKSIGDNWIVENGVSICKGTDKLRREACQFKCK